MTTFSQSPAPVASVDFADLDTDFSNAAAKPALMDAAATRAMAHVANGGENASFDCMRCRGSGNWRHGYSCFACDGTGKVSARKLGSQKAKVTRANNLHQKQVEFSAANPGLVAFLCDAASWSEFASSMLAAYETYGALTDKQLGSVRSMMAKVEAKKQAAKEQHAAAQSAKSGVVGVDAIRALFDTAISNGLSKPQFRTEFLTIKQAKGKPDTLYVTDKRQGGEYVGKIVAGAFEARREASADTLSILCEIAKDPSEAAIRYGRATGVCGCCGRELTDAGSVEAGIGPVCAEKWGF